MSEPGDPLESIRDELTAIDRAGLRRELRVARGPAGPVIQLDGRVALNFCSNNYLDLANHPALPAAIAAAVQVEGVGAGAARLIGGNFNAHRDLERALAAWKGTEAALLFGSGYQANVGILSALAGPADAVFSDALNHASIVDGARLSRASVHVYPHRDVVRLGELLDTARHARRRIIVTETVFSMDGDTAPLPALVELAGRHAAILVADDAHAVGVLGERGVGLAAPPGVHVLMGTLGKALGAAGAYAAGSREVVELLVHRARSFVFTTAPPVPVVAAAAAALHIVQSPEGDERRRTLQERGRHLRRGLDALGIPLPPDLAGHIFPLIVEDGPRAVDLSARLFDDGVFVQAIRPPTVPERTARLRLTLSSGHTVDHVERLLAALGRQRDHLLR